MVIYVGVEYATMTAPLGDGGQYLEMLEDSVCNS